MTDVSTPESQPRKPMISSEDRPYAVILGVVIIALLGGLFFSIKNNSAELERMKPKMLELAQAGKPAAILWVQRHIPSKLSATAEGDTLVLKQVAELGDVETMFRYAHRLEVFGDKEAANIWYEKAAAEGYPPAVKVMLEAIEESK